MKSFSDLRYFCQYIVNKYGSPANASEEEKAQEFRDIYLRNLPLEIRTLRAIAAACGIRVNGIDGKVFPQNIRGYHDVFEEKRNIYYKKGDTKSGIENTILHEFREMIEPVFTEVCPDYSPLRTNAVHIAANKFATAVLLPKDRFKKEIYKTGFDAIALSGLNSKSCSQVLLRMGEVLHGKIFFYSALYERSLDQKEWQVNYWTSCMNDEDPDANVYGLNGILPRKGRPVDQGSLVEMVIKCKRAHLAEHITLLDEFDDEGLVAMASPVIISNSVTKVALTVLLRSSGNLLEPQIKRTRPVVIEGFHRHL